MRRSSHRPALDMLYKAWHLTALFVCAEGKPVRCHGTAFGIDFREKDCIVVITNRHLIDSDYPEPDARLVDCTLSSINITFLTSNVSTGVPLHSTHTLSTVSPLFHPDDTVDVVGIKVNSSDLRSQPGVESAPTIATDSLVDVDFVKNMLDVTQGVNIPGFPGDTYDGQGVLPICRSGRIASDPRLTFRTTIGPAMRKDGRDKVALDAYVTEGNSGSPVFLERGSMTDDIEELGPHPLLGVAVGHTESAAESGKIHSGISYMHTVKSIREVLSLVI